MARRNEDDRDYAAEMREVIDQFTAQGPYSATSVAEEIVGKLRATDADLLVGWLDMHAVQVLRMAIIAIDRARRVQARMGAKAKPTGGPLAPTKRSVFAKATAKAERGDTSALDEYRHGWLDTRYVVEGVRRKLADLTGPEVLTVADTYRKSAESDLMEEAFMRAVAKRCGKRKVGEVFTNETLDRLRRSIAG